MTQVAKYVPRGKGLAREKIKTICLKKKAVLTIEKIKTICCFLIVIKITVFLIVIKITIFDN